MASRNPMQTPGESRSHADDVALVRGLAARDPDAVRAITMHNNQRLFRAAWAILRNRAEAEDAVQSAYLSAFAAAESFEGRSSLTTWLTRIVINEALGRKRATQRRRDKLDGSSVTMIDEYRDKLMRGSELSLPDDSAARGQIRRILEEAIGRLPENYRIVFVLREVEGLSVEEVSETLGIPPATVKTRALRARRRLQDELAPEMRSTLSGTFPFAGADCTAMTDRVLRLICAEA